MISSSLKLNQGIPLSQEKPTLDPIAEQLGNVLRTLGCSTASLAHDLQIKPSRLGAICKLPVGGVITTKVIHRIVEGLAQIADRDSTNHDQILEHRNEIIKAAGDRAGTGVLSLYGELLAEFGEAECQKKTGLTASGLAKRKQDKKALNVSYQSIAEKVKRLDHEFEKMDPAEHWKSERSKRIQRSLLEEARSRERPEIIVQLHMMLESLGSVISAENGKTNILNIKLPAQVCSELADYRYVNYKYVKPLFQALNRQGLISDSELPTLAQTWKAAERAQGIWVHEELGEIAKKQNVDLRKIAEALNTFSSPAKDYDAIWKFLNGYKKYSTLPVAIVTELIVPSKSKAVALIAKARVQILSQLRRSASFKANPDIYTERIIWGVRLEDLSAYKPADLQNLEDHNKGELAVSKSEVLGAIEAEGRRKLKLAADSLKSKEGGKNNKKFCDFDHRTTSSFYAAFLGTPYAEAVIKGDPKLRKLYALEADLPDLNALRSHAISVNASRQNDLELSWRDNYPKILKARNMPDLARLILTYIASQSETPYTFLKSKHDEAKTKTFIGDITCIKRLAYLPPKRLEELLAGLAVEKKSPFYKLVVEVNKVGAISKALPKVCKNLPTQYAQSIESAQQICIKASPESKHSANETNLLLSAISAFPGVTLKEIELLGTDAGSETQQILTQLWKDAGEKGFTTSMIVTAIEDIHPGFRKLALELYAVNLARGSYAAFIPPALLVCCGTKKGQELGANTSAIQQAIKSDYERVGITPTKNMITLAYWGLELDDMIAENNYQRLLALNALPDAKTQIDQDTELYAQKNCYAALKQLSVFFCPAEISELVRLYETAARGRNKELNSQAGINEKLRSEYSKKERTPTLARFNGMMNAASLEPQPAWKVAWYLQYADQFKGDPILRVYNTILMSGDFPAASKAAELIPLLGSSQSRNGFEYSLFTRLGSLHTTNRLETGQHLAGIANGEYAKEHIEFLRSILELGKIRDFAQLAVECNGNLVQAGYKFLRANQESISQKAINYLYDKVLNQENPHPNGIFEALGIQTEASEALAFIEKMPGINSEELKTAILLVQGPDRLQNCKTTKEKLILFEELEKLTCHLTQEQILAAFSGFPQLHISVISNASDAWRAELKAIKYFSNPEKALELLSSRFLEGAQWENPDYENLHTYVQAIYRGRLLDSATIINACYPR